MGSNSAGGGRGVVEGGGSLQFLHFKDFVGGGGWVGVGDWGQILYNFSIGIIFRI